jgi:outer membrane immunogenic protein
MRIGGVAAVSLLVVAFSNLAAATDLPMPAKAPRAVVAPAPAIYSWTGFYAGVNLGGGWVDNDNSSTLTALPGGVPPAMVFSAATSTSFSGIVGGGQIGYNWQTGHLVFGVEADIDGSSASGSTSVGCGITGLACTMAGTPKVDAFGTIRGRLGYAQDNWLFYVTGGFAWQHVSNTVTDTTAAGSATMFNASTTQGGYVIGVGAEMAFAPRWTAGLEYLYLDTGTFTLFNGAVPAGSLGIFGAPAGTTATFNDSERMQTNVVRARVNYRFQ